ncbi:MAG TPA: YciI family protein [Opitutaceae bacterium]|nr:YciI family protein [Opitutaceae bacterium]
MLLLRQPAGPVPPPEELQKIMVRFQTWMDGMMAKGMVVGTNGLDVTGKVLRGRRGASITDGPFAETKEIVGGYVLITAASLDEAVEAARDCPGLDYAMAVEVRPVRPRV